MDQKIINKVTELMARVIKLNEKAERGFYYAFDFSGHTKQVDFRKLSTPEYRMVISAYSYLEMPHLSVSLEDIEDIIAAEEEAQKEGQK